MTRSLLAIALTLTALAIPCPAPAGEPEQIQLVSAEQVEKMLGAKDLKVYDVNIDELWEKYHLPGAIHVGAHALASILPSDKTASLVFYCTGPKCMSSHSAALKAIALGYKNVFVMNDGIGGWLKAGKRVEKGGTGVDPVP